jgi:hypothetical protein
MIGCGSYGGRQYQFRNALIENLYRAYIRVPDKQLARESFELVEELFPISSEKRIEEPRMQHPLEAEARPNEPLSILLRGLALVSTTTEWRQVLNAARAGDGSLGLLQNQDHRKLLDYALHRCRGIHRWRLIQSADGTYSINKKPGVP